MSTCNANTKKGKKCMNSTIHPSGLCIIHRPKKIEKSEEVTIQNLDGLEMGDFTKLFPNEIIYEILKYLDIFELSKFSIVNVSCHRFVKYYPMIHSKTKENYKMFMMDYKEKPSIINMETAKKYNIPYPSGQQLILYPKSMVDLAFIVSLIQNGKKLEFEIQRETGKIDWYYDKSTHIENLTNDRTIFAKNFLVVPSTMRTIVESDLIQWNFRELYLYYQQMINHINIYCKQHRERERKLPILMNT
jgi:hypothetical protein